MVYGLWFMVYGLWFMVYGLWFMVYGLWFVHQPLQYAIAVFWPEVDEFTQGILIKVSGREWGVRMRGK